MTPAPDLCDDCGEPAVVGVEIDGINTPLCARCLPSRNLVMDLVNHPPHYTAHPSGVECIDITEHYNFCVGNAIKYLWRAGLKDGTDPVEDLQKAVWYINREIERRTRD